MCWAVSVCRGKPTGIIFIVSRTKFDEAAGQAIAESVRDIEKNTDAELVIVIRGRSGSYRHVDYLWGGVVAFLGLLFLLFSPIEFHTYWVPIDVILLFVAGAFVSSRSNILRRLLTSHKSRSRAARTGAAAMFYEAGIANTLAESGVLIYLSLLEQHVEVLADRGVLKAVPALKWNNGLYELKVVARKAEPGPVIKAIRGLGGILAEHMPATGKNPNELADGPRIELK